MQPAPKVLVRPSTLAVITERFARRNEAKEWLRRAAGSIDRGTH